MAELARRQADAQQAVACAPQAETGDTLPYTTSRRPTTQNKTSYRTELSTSQSYVDYVILFKVKNDIAASEICLRALLQELKIAGLWFQVREAGTESDLLILVKCPTQRLHSEVYTSRIKDWLCGIRLAKPESGQGFDMHEPVTDSERLRLIFMILTAPKRENGAGITPRHGKWKHIESIFPLHNKAFDQAWLKRWSTKWIIDDIELKHLCEHFGTKVAMYFAFLQSYSMSLAVAATIGLTAFFFLPEYSALYSTIISVWAVFFLELWERRQKALAYDWNVRNCSQMEHSRAEFEGTEIVYNPVTGEKEPAFSSIARLSREALVIPFVVFAAALLAVVLTAIFSVEVFIGEVYDGPFKSILTFTPTILFSVLVGPFTRMYMTAAHRLTMFENHETDARFNAAITRKSFLLNFMTSYTALFLTLYVYLPFGHMVVPKLDVFGITSSYASYGITAKPFVLDNARIRNQLFYFAVTAQIVNFFMEFLLPIILRLIKGEARDLQAKYIGINAFKPLDRPEEAEFLSRVRFEANLPEYDTYGDFSELVVQFGYTVMFSTIWTLTPVCAFINNVVELRADAAKLCQNMKRPIPMRADSIGPWSDNLVFLTWLGSITSPSIVYLLRGDAPSAKSFSWLALCCFFAEHAFLLLRSTVRTVMARFSDKTDLAVKKEEYAMKKQHLDALDRPAISNSAFKEDLSFYSTDTEAVLSEGCCIMRRKPRDAVNGNQEQAKKDL